MIKNIIKESPLIEVYRHCHVTIENAFHLQHHTLCHSPPDMTKTIQWLVGRINKKCAHAFKVGRSALQPISDQIICGMMIETQKEAKMEEEDISINEIEPDDLTI